MVYNSFIVNNNQYTEWRDIYMNWDFIYTRQMQSIHIVNSFITNTLVMYLFAEMLLMLVDEKASIKQKFTFSFITGTLFQTAFIYAVYFIGGAVSFSPLIYILLTTPNPIFAVLYCVIGKKVLKLSSVRSVKTMGYLYLFYLLNLNLNTLLAPIFFVQSSDRYNYLLAMCKQTVFSLTGLIAYFVLVHQIKKRKYLIRLTDKLFIDIKKEMLLFFMKTLFFYVLVATVPSLIVNQILANSLTLLILSLFLALNIYIDISDYQKSVIENKAIHINALSKEIDEFRGVKHDFYNILQTYSGYLHLGNLDKLREYHSSLLSLATDSGKMMELTERMSDNPALVSLLIKKVEYAEEMNVKMAMSFKSGLDDLYIDNLDICRCIACLLDNAIEAASESEGKRVFFTIEHKKGGSKLIIITNSTASDVDVGRIIVKGYGTKQGHTGLGMSNILRIIDSYGNCTFQMRYLSNVFASYIGLRKI